MSDYRRVNGTLRLVEAEDIEKYCKEVVESKSKSSFDEKQLSLYGTCTYEEYLCNYYDDEYCILNDKLYEIVKLEDSEPEDYYCHITNNPDGTISFETMFYDGGTCWQEMVEDELSEK